MDTLWRVPPWWRPGSSEPIGGWCLRQLWGLSETPELWGEHQDGAHYRLHKYHFFIFVGMHDMNFFQPIRSHFSHSISFISCSFWRRRDSSSVSVFPQDRRRSLPARLFSTTWPRPPWSPRPPITAPDSEIKVQRDRKPRELSFFFKRVTVLFWYWGDGGIK